jgi:pyridoxal phosphate enzyme (YggS family)
LFPLDRRPYTVRLTFSGGARTRDLASISKRLGDVRERLSAALERAGRPSGAARLLAETKGVPAAIVREAVEHGIGELGESRVQEAEPKIALVAPGPRWHLIGHLQTNKAKRAVALFEEIHSIDSGRLALEIARRAAEAGRVITGYVEVNTSGDAAKHGVAPEGALDLIEQVASLDGIRLAGLMTIGPLRGGAEGARASFRALRALRDQAEERGLLPGGSGLSMGMSEDFEIAAEEGATIVRVGSAIFGSERGGLPVAGREPPRG